MESCEARLANGKTDRKPMCKWTFEVLCAQSRKQIKAEVQQTNILCLCLGSITREFVKECRVPSQWSSITTWS